MEHIQREWKDGKFHGKEFINGEWEMNMKDKWIRTEVKRWSAKMD